MLGSYPPRAENDGSAAYYSALAAALLDHPREVAIDCVDPVHGVVRQCPIIPSPADIHKWCERAAAAMHDVVRREDERIAEAKRTRELLGDAPSPSLEERRAAVARAREKFGPNWGLQRMDAVDIARGKTPEGEKAAREAQRKANDERMQAFNDRAILAEYARRGFEPVRNKNGVLLAYDLVKQINPGLLVPVASDAWRAEVETTEAGL